MSGLLVLVLGTGGMFTAAARPAAALADEKPASTDAQSAEAVRIKTEISARLEQAKKHDITVEAMPFSDGKYGVVLSGKGVTEATCPELSKLVTSYAIKGVTLVNCKVEKAEEPERTEPRVYPLLFNDQRVQDLADSLNKILGGTTEKPVVFRSQQFLIVNASPKQQEQVKKVIDEFNCAEPLEKTEVLDLTFLDSVLTPLDPTATAETPGTRVDDAIKAINASIGNGRELVRRSRQHVFITGTEEVRRAIRAALLAIDSPAPQVQLDVYPIQISGDRGAVTCYSQKVSKAFRSVQEIQRRVQERLVQEVSGQCVDPKAQNIANILDELGFSKETTRPLSLIEAQVFLTLLPRDKREEVITSVAKSYRVFKDAAEEKWLHTAADERSSKKSNKPAPSAEATARLEKEPDLSARMPLQALALHYGVPVSDGVRVFEAANGKDPVGATRTGIRAFVAALLIQKAEDDQEAKGRLLKADAALDGEGKVDEADPYVTAARLFPKAKRSRALVAAYTASAALDRQLKSAMDAYAADMNRELMQPMMRYLQREIPRQSSGITLAGNTRMVVSSSIETILDAKMSSYADATRPRPFGPDILDSAFPVKLPYPTEAPAKKKKEMEGEKEGEDDSTGGDKEAEKPAPKLTENAGAKGIFELVAASNPAAAALLAAAFADKVQPSFLKVAPGLAIRVRPRVLPDNGSARLQVSMRVGVQTSITDADQQRTDVFRGPLPDAVESHEVRTDAIINAFDLFDISSLSFATSAPQAPYYVPILGRLPLIGEAFQFPRDNKQVHHESIILVNATILPRSMDLATRFFNR